MRSDEAIELAARAQQPFAAQIGQWNGHQMFPGSGAAFVVAYLPDGFFSGNLVDWRVWRHSCDFGEAVLLWQGGRLPEPNAASALVFAYWDDCDGFHRDVQTVVLAVDSATHVNPFVDGSRVGAVGGMSLSRVVRDYVDQTYPPRGNSNAKQKEDQAV